MANATPQVAPASSTLEKLKGTFVALFPLLARPDPATAYRERLCAYERTMFDKFYAFKDSYPDHQVFVGTAESCKLDEFKSYATVEDAKQVVDTLVANKYGPQPFIALDLCKSFQEQWTQKPDGSDFSDLLKNNPISRVSGLVLSAPRQASIKSSYTHV